MRSALTFYGQQTWPYKEAVVINGTDLDIPNELASQRTFKIKAKYLGELKNLALYNATGEWCFPWLDDCRYAPGYIAWHMHRRGKAFPTVVANPLAEVLKDGIVHTVDWEVAPAASFFRFSPYIYDQDGSDVRFLAKYPDRNLMKADGGLVTRFFEDYAAD